MEKVALELLPALYEETTMYNDIVSKMKEYFSSPIVDGCNKGNKEIMEEALAADYHHRLNNILGKSLKNYAKVVDYSYIEDLIKNKRWDDIEHWSELVNLYG